MNKRKLIFDYDSTIVDSVTGYCDTYTQMYVGHPDFILPNPDEVVAWDLSCQCPLEKHPEKIFGMQEFFEKVKFFPNAKEVLEELNEEFEIAICTIGTLDNIFYKTAWCSENLPFIDNYIFVSNGNVATSGHVKMGKDMVNMAGAIFVDDHARNLIGSNADVKIRYGKEFSWNKDWDGIKVYNWLDLRDEVRKYRW